MASKTSYSFLQNIRRPSFLNRNDRRTEMGDRVASPPQQNEGGVSPIEKRDSVSCTADYSVSGMTDYGDRTATDPETGKQIELPPRQELKPKTVTRLARFFTTRETLILELQPDFTADDIFLKIKEKKPELLMSNLSLLIFGKKYKVGRPESHQPLEKVGRSLVRHDIVVLKQIEDHKSE